MSLAKTGGTGSELTKAEFYSLGMKARAAGLEAMTQDSTLDQIKNKT
jgi:hypothetical protein